MSQQKREPKKYEQGLTKQSFLPETSIDALLDKHARAGTLSHIQKYQGEYGSFIGFDFETAQAQIARANTMFEQLPAEVRREFHNDPAAFIDFVNDPANKDDLATKLPALAKQGTQMPNVRPTGENPPLDPTPPTPPRSGGQDPDPSPDPNPTP